jgi:putative SOS response-associated peptidase YedK
MPALHAHTRRPVRGFNPKRVKPASKVRRAQRRSIVPADEPMFAFAGLWENWRDRTRDGAEWIRICTIITGEPNELVAPIHDRMPVILPREAWAKWLGEEIATQDELQSLLTTWPADRMRMYPVSPRVNSVKYDDARLIEPAVASRA